MHRVFVYGTLKRGFPNHDAWMKDYPCIGRFRTCVAFPLVVGGKWFSPYLIAEPGVGVPDGGHGTGGGEDGASVEPEERDVGEEDGVGLWTRDTSFLTDGFFILEAYDFVETSYHILTTEGARGRDTVGKE